MYMIKIGILGLALRNSTKVGGNMGCFALGYSFFEVLNTIALRNEKQMQIVDIKTVSLLGYLKLWIIKILRKESDVMSYYTSLYSNLSFKRVYIIRCWNNLFLMDKSSSYDYVFDFTAGDSFTDIYGKKRFFLRTQVKKKIIDSNIPLVLGSQTIGPFGDSDVLSYAVKVIEGSNKVFVRDSQSQQYVESICNTKPILTTDVAFLLPYDKNKYQFESKKKKAGFNPSGLLWLGGYTKNNQFGLTVNYQQYCRCVISSLYEMGYEVHLILHAYYLKGQKREDYADNDRLAVETLCQEFPSAKVSPNFQTPMDAKSYISNMDLFIGARMHATVAAISSGVPVIPFSYSRKFEGLFSSLNYPFVVEGTKWDTPKAIDNTLEWIKDINTLKEHITNSSTVIKLKNQFLFNEYEKIILNQE